MLDSTLNQWLKAPLQAAARKLHRTGIQPDHLTWAGFAVGLLAVPLIATGHTHWALVAMALNRLADGLDGTLARLTTPTDRGAFLDIALDFLFYASIPLAFALANPADNAWPLRCCCSASWARAAVFWRLPCWQPSASWPARNTPPKAFSTWVG
jgi:phosphatidylglycerophosphate synthase